MSDFQLFAPLTETALEDRVCQGTDCTNVISRGMPYFPVASHNPSRPPRNVCHPCFEKILQRGGTLICERQDQPPDPQEVQAAVRASRSKASVNPPAVVPFPPGHGTRPPPAAQPHRDRSRRSVAALMLPPSAPARPLRNGPNVRIPSAWSPAGPSGPGRASNSSAPSSTPSRSGYSQNHGSYFAETERWSANAVGHLAETISLSISALHDGGTRKGRSPGTPFGNITEGLKGIDARIRANRLVETARKTLNPLIIAFCPEFPWRPDEFVVRDEAWVDLSNHEETAETCQGYFYRECLHLKSKGYVFKSKQFHLNVVVPQNQWDEYLQFVSQPEAHATTIKRSTSRAPAHSEFVSRRQSRKAAASVLTQAASSGASHPTNTSLSLFLDSEESSGEAQGTLMEKPTAASTPISLKRSHHDMRSEHAGSIASTPTGKSPPTKKAGVKTVVKVEPLSPDHNNLREALRVGGAADLDPLQLLNGTVHHIDFYPIPTVSIELILSNPDYRKFDLDPKKKVTTLHPGQLRLGSQGSSFIGAGAFKTTHTATLILSNPTESGIGSHANEEIVIKRPYQRQVNQSLSGPFKPLHAKDESAMLFREANVLYWAKALFKLAEDFIAKRLTKASEPPPFEIPSIRFVDAGLAFHLNNPAKGRAVTVDCTYLCEEEIQHADTAFIKFVHNGDCAPLPEPYEPGYKIAQFLVFTQHVQYVKTKGLAYVSDYQGTTSLLTDPQVITHSSIGRDLFCEGNMENALEAFEGDHVCNHFCKWPGFKLSAFRNNGKGKGKESDPLIVSSDSDSD